MRKGRVATMVCGHGIGVRMAGCLRKEGFILTEE